MHKGTLLYLTMLYEQDPSQNKILLLEKLEKRGYIFDPDIVDKSLPDFCDTYQEWYSEALECIRQLMPKRIDDFTCLYKSSIKRVAINPWNYTISDYLMGYYQKRRIRSIVPADAIPKFNQQLNIVKSLRRKYKSSLLGIKQILQAQLFDSEIETAQELCDNGFLRAAGVVAGVVLEKHLVEICAIHNLMPRDRFPAIAVYNDLLKDKEVIKMQDWKFIQH